VNFSGATGKVSFDEKGHRKNYQLDVLEQTLDNEPVKVAILYSQYSVGFPSVQRAEYNLQFFTYIITL